MRKFEFVAKTQFISVNNFNCFENKNNVFVHLPQYMSLPFD